MKKAVLFLGLLLLTAAVTSAQVPTITNSTLQKFQEQRVAADRDYRDNYARLGFPSPEELERRREIDMSDRLQLADQLRQARLEKERLELEQRELDLRAAAMVVNNDEPENRYNGFYGGYLGSFGGYGGYGGYYSGGRYNRRYGRFGFDPYLPFGGGYRATAVGFYPDWSPGRVRFVNRGRSHGGRRGIHGIKR